MFFHGIISFRLYFPELLRQLDAESRIDTKIEVIEVVLCKYEILILLLGYLEDATASKRQF